MRRLLLLAVLLTLFCPWPAWAHVGSPDVFYDGMVGKWRVHIAIRMPGVVPGRAEIIAQVQSQEPVVVSFTPLASRNAVSNAPPAETAKLVPGETNIYTGDLWLMTIGAYSIDVRIHGASGDGAVQIPVNSVAIMQLPLPPWLGGLLLALGVILFCGGMAIVAAAAGESVLPVGAAPGKTERRKYWMAAAITGIVLALALLGGKKWWDADDRDFRARLRGGGWPDVAADVHMEGAQRILALTFGSTGNSSSGPNAYLGLSPDHGKLLHLFLVRQPGREAFGHIHPVRKGNRTFAVALPPLPEGDYELFCDLTLDSGLSSTATNRVHLPAMPATTNATNSLEPDADDSWAVESAAAVRADAGHDTICRLPDGTQIIWKAHPPPRVKQDAALRFEVLDQAGQPAQLEPYMGMTSHAAVLRSDGRVFDHLHPSGNYSMAAQMIFDAKIAKETGALPPGMMKMPDGSIMDRSMMGRASNGDETSLVSLPYEFPAPGNYRIWVQIKIAGKIMTGIFDTTVR